MGEDVKVANQHSRNNHNNFTTREEDRQQSAFISEDEVKKVVKYLANNYKDEVPSDIALTGPISADKSIFDATLDDSDEGDELYEEAREIVISAGKASTSYLQRKLGVGYARAARIIDILEERGVVGPGSGSKPREVLEKTMAEESQGFQ
jgi:S-DNA-T family DNA segregation ATPase FtsK/SpoIIIE